MNPAYLFAGALAIVIILMVYSSRKQRARAERRREAELSRPRRQQHLEHKMAEEAFAPVRRHTGDVFTGFSIIRTFNEVRMDIETRAPWNDFSNFSKYLIIRHLWRMLTKFVTANVDVTVVVQQDPKPVRWTAEQTAQFNDRGATEPWNEKPTQVGTLISDRGNKITLYDNGERRRK